MNVWEQEAQCNACKGTGIYVGFAEMDGAGVQCSKCRGTGKIILRIKWEPFTGRKQREGIRHVYRVNPGIKVGEGGGHHFSDFGGVPYDQWLCIPTDKWPYGKEDREHTCPAWWYQCADDEKKPRWDRCEFGRFPDCSHFCNKEKCWEQWDSEYGCNSITTKDNQ